MKPKLLLPTLTFCLVLPMAFALAQHSSPSCTSCSEGSSYDDRHYYDDGYQYDDGGVYHESMPCECDDCYGRTYRTPVRRIAGNVVGRVRGRAAARFGGRFGGQGLTYGRPGDSFGAPFIDGECGDCNWGPVYLSIFAGVAFIDNFQTSFTFDNGMAGFQGVQETSFSTLDGVAAGGAIGRYFYRQARVEFEYTFRDNGIGDLGINTYSDDLSTPQNNDVLISSVVTGADGNMESNSFMFNIVADLRPRTVGCVSAYLGGGIGVLYVDSDIATATDLYDINDEALAFQGIVGINFPVRDQLDLYSEYRYLGADSINVDRTDMMGMTESLGAFSFDSHSFVFGMRFLR